MNNQSIKLTAYTLKTVNHDAEPIQKLSIQKITIYTSSLTQGLQELMSLGHTVPKRAWPQGADNAMPALHVYDGQKTFQASYGYFSFLVISLTNLNLKSFMYIIN